MRKLAIIGGLSLMSTGTASMLWHKQKLDFNPNTIALATGGFFVVVGITYRIQ
jgi:hypothetical protein